MRKTRILCLTLALCLVLSSAALLTGCHGAKEADPFVMPETFNTEKQYELTFWAKSDTNVVQTNIYKKTIEDFQKLYPNIKVNLSIYTDYRRIYNDVITNIPTSTTPNVCITYPDHIATYLTGTNAVVPLEELMADGKYGFGGSELKYDGPDAGELVDKYVGECTIDGVQYALPFMRSTEACYINKTFVEKLGYTVPDVLTWDWIFEVSEAAMTLDADGNYAVNGQKVLIPFIYKSTDNMMIQYLRQAGADYASDEGEILIFNDTTKDFLKSIAPHAGTRAFSTFKISSYPANFLNRGQCIFAIDSTAGATWMGTDAPLSDISEDTLVRFETVVRPVPQVTEDQHVMISQGPSVCIFNKADPDEVLASWLFAQYLLTNEVQIPYAETEGYVPVTRKAQTDPAYLDYLSRAGEDNKEHYPVKIEATKMLIDHIDDTFVTPVFNGSASLRDASGELIEGVTKSMRRGETVDEAYFDKLFDDMKSLYRLDESALMLGGRASDPGPLPAASIALLTALVVVWVGIGGFALYRKIKEKKNADSE